MKPTTPPRISDFFIISNSDPQAATTEVKNMMAKGWQPFQFSTTDIEVTVAMVKYEVVFEE